MEDDILLVVPIEKFISLVYNFKQVNVHLLDTYNLGRSVRILTHVEGELRNTLNIIVHKHVNAKHWKHQTVTC